MQGLTTERLPLGSENGQQRRSEVQTHDQPSMLRPPIDGRPGFVFGPRLTAVRLRLHLPIQPLRGRPAARSHKVRRQRLTQQRRPLAMKIEGAVCLDPKANKGQYYSYNIGICQSRTVVSRSEGCTSGVIRSTLGVPPGKTSVSCQVHPARTRKPAAYMRVWVDRKRATIRKTS